MEQICNVTPQASIIIGIIFFGAILTFIICFKKQPGVLGKKGLFATAMLGIYILFAQGILHINMKQLLIPILGFSVLSIVEIFRKENG